MHRRRLEREEIYKVALLYLMRTIFNMILGEDFNSILAQANCIGKINFSRGLQ
jgi:hypothetical protein